jgi:hypothetical protein
MLRLSDFPFVEVFLSHQNPKKGGFPRAVGPDDPHTGSVTDQKGRISEKPLCSVCFAYIFDVQHEKAALLSFWSVYFR